MAATDDDDEVPEGRALTLAATSRKREAEDWALVLTAEGIPNTTRRRAAGWRLEVEADRRAEADMILAAWRRERAARRTAPPLEPVPETDARQLALAYGLALGLVAFHAALVSAGLHEDYVDAGESQAVLVLEGQLHRTLTALTLHADASHVAGNALFGGFFLATLAGRLGLGCSVLAFLASGALGNLANALWYGHAHSSVGASTGVFGLVGVLAGLAAWRRHQTLPRRRGAWVAFAAGLGVVAMLGGPGPQVDFSAHVFGLAAGAMTGVAISLPLARRPRPGFAAQATAFTFSVALVLGCWRLA